MLDQLNEAVATMGGQWVKLNRKEHGVVEGALVDFEVRPKTYEGKPVLSQKSGQQRSEWVLTLRVAGAEEPSKVSLNESAQRALAAAIRASGEKPVVGGIVKIAVKADPASKTEQAEYQAKYTPPAPVTTTDIDSVFGDDTAGATTPAEDF